MLAQVRKLSCTETCISSMRLELLIAFGGRLTVTHVGAWYRESGTNGGNCIRVGNSNVFKPTTLPGEGTESGDTSIFMMVFSFLNLKIPKMDMNRVWGCTA